MLRLRSCLPRLQQSLRASRAQLCQSGSSSYSTVATSFAISRAEAKTTNPTWALREFARQSASLNQVDLSAVVVAAEGVDVALTNTQTVVEAVAEPVVASTAEVVSENMNELESTENVDTTMYAIKRTYQPSWRKRKNKHGFLARVRSLGGRKVVFRRQLKKRWYVSV